MCSIARKIKNNDDFRRFGEIKDETKHVQVNDNKTSQNRRADACVGALISDL